MAFEPGDKKNRPILEWMKAQKALVVDPTSSSRNSIRKLFSTFGLSATQSDAAESFSDGFDALKNGGHNIVFAEYELGDHNGLELLEEHKKQIPNRNKAIFVLISGKNSKSIAGMAAEADCDALIVKPITFDILEKKFLEILSKKMNPSKYLDAIEDGKKLISQNKHPEALQAFQSAKTLDPKPALACYHIGQTHQILKELDQAIKSFEEGLTYDPTHYRCLLGMIESLTEKKEYEKAYTYGAKLTQSHSVSPKQIPTLIRLCVTAGKYQDVMGFTELFSSVEEIDSTVSMYVSAGLVVCGKYFAKQGKKPEASNALKTADNICRGKESIVREIVSTYYQLKLQDEAQKILSKSSKSVQDSKEVRLAEFEFYLDSRPANETLKTALDLIKSNMHSPKVFEVAIQKSIELARKPDVIQDLIEQAVKAYPDRKSTFETLKPNAA